MKTSDATLSEAYVRMWSGAGDASCAWASDEMDDLVMGEPDRVWKIILMIAAGDAPREARAVLAAGPLENLLREHGVDFIDRVEERAGQDLSFRELLGHIHPEVCRSPSLSVRLWRAIGRVPP